MKRIIIIGNSGSGKTWISKKISEKFNFNIIHLDHHFWEPGGFNKKRDKSVVYGEIKQLSQNEKWIMEGVFGELAELAIPRATFLIFLDKTWEECKNALLSRGSESSKQLDPVEAEKNFMALLDWAGDYYQRDDLRSQIGHTKLFDHFTGKKIRLSNRTDMKQFLETIQRF